MYLTRITVRLDEFMQHIKFMIENYTFLPALLPASPNAATKDITYTGFHLVFLFLGEGKGVKKQSNPSANKLIIEEKEKSALQ